MRGGVPVIAASNEAQQGEAGQRALLIERGAASERLAVLARVRDVLDEELRTCPVDRVAAMYVVAFRITNAVMNKEPGK